MADNVVTRRPRVVFECSSGVSTLVVARCLQQNGVGHVYSLEHDAEYAAKTVGMLEKYGVSDWATVIYAPLVGVGTDAPWYDETRIPANLAPIDMLIVDGPPYNVAPLARLPALPKLRPRLSDSAVVILDDAARDAEKEILKRWITTFPDLSVQILRHEKGCAVLTRKNWSPT